MIIIPLIDPKKRLQQMQNKYYIIKLIVIGSMVLMSLISIYAAMNTNKDMRLLFMLAFSFIFILLGNYLATIKPNYFIGIRTP